MQNKFILDACCGGRHMWFNKKHPNALYIDIRKEEKGLIPLRPNFEVNPDQIMDFRKLTFTDKSFKLVVWDPPHSSTFSKTSIMRKKFGTLDPQTWQADLQQGFSECWRVLEDYGVLIFKWSDIEIPYKEILSYLGEEPLFMNVSAGRKALKDKTRSYWFCFMKIPKEKGGENDKS